MEINLDNSESEPEASEKLSSLTQWTLMDKETVVISEYLRLVQATNTENRQYIHKQLNRAKESVPANIRLILENIFQGHCQICDFWFLKKDKQPYFEIHHLDPSKGHNPKNLLLVCGNCHNLFEYSSVNHEYDNDAWLVRVSFNERLLPVKHIPLPLIKQHFIKELFI